MTTFAERLDALLKLEETPSMTVDGLIVESRAFRARLRLAVELLEDVANAGEVQPSLRWYEELQMAALRADARALVAKVKGELT